MKKWLYLIFPFIIIWVSCRQSYQPPAISSKNNFLVVEGIISGPDTTIIKLSRTVNIGSKLTSKPEPGAIATIEDDQNHTYPLTETGKGNYAYSGLTTDRSRKYRLRIKTLNAEEYLSDFVPVLDSPPIDSVSIDVDGSISVGPGLNVYVSTHDQVNNTRYYRWDYQETWIFHSFYPSFFYSNGDTVLVRNEFTQNITDCWSSDSSSTIILGSSAALSKSVILKNPIAFVPSTSEKMETKYSILVRQYALTADAFSYYSIIKKNTEQLGSIFDAQPTSIQGNIHCISEPSKPALGYITAGNLSSQRIFIASDKLPTWTATYPYVGCHYILNWPTDPCCYYNLNGRNQVDDYINFNKSNIPHPFIPIKAVNPIGPPIGFFASTPECVDCTIRGTNKRPAFWR